MRWCRVSKEVFGLDPLEFLFDQGIDTAKLLDIYIGRGYRPGTRTRHDDRVTFPLQFLDQRFAKELLECSAAPSCRCLGFAEKIVRQVNRRLHAPILPYLRERLDDWSVFIAISFRVHARSYTGAYTDSETDPSCVSMTRGV